MSAVQSHPEIVIFRSGASTVRADYFPGETVLDTARRAGVPIATSCELGNCGTCIVIYAIKSAQASFCRSCHQLTLRIVQCLSGCCLISTQLQRQLIVRLRLASLRQ